MIWLRFDNGVFQYGDKMLWENNQPRHFSEEVLGSCPQFLDITGLDISRPRSEHQISQFMMNNQGNKMRVETDDSTGINEKRTLHRKESSLQCGINSLERCRTMRMYTVNLGLLFVVQIAFATYVIGSSRTLEKRFGLSSKQGAALHAIIDSIEVASVLFIGYFARHTHKPRVIGISVLFNVIGAIVYAMPYFLFGSREDMQSKNARHMTNNLMNDGNWTDSSKELMCSGNRTNTCSEHEMAMTENNQVAFSLLTFACVCLGIGGSFARVLGLTYIDENVHSQDTPLYFGLASSVMPLGPVIGFALAAICTRLPENVISSELSPNDPAYIGAWWLGFLIIGAFVLIFAIPMFLFPKHFAHYYTEKDQNLTEVIIKDEGTKLSIASIRDECKGFFRSLWKLVTNPTLVALTITNVSGIIVMMGTLANATRYMEVQFNVPAFKANIISAISLASSCVIGNMTIGVIMKKKKIGVSGSALICAFTDIAGVVILAILMGIGCGNDGASGTGNLSWGESNNKDMGCNSHCSCQTEAMPVCGPDGLDYLSPCHAGCDAIINATHFGNCSCFPDMFVSKGFCHQVCEFLPVYILFIILACFVLSLGRVPSMVVNMRIVDPELKSLSLSIISFASNLFGFIPAPVLFGALSDAACSTWQESCDSIGACLVYDEANYRHYIMGTGLGFETIAVIFSFLTWISIKRDLRLGKYEDHEDETCKEVNEKHAAASESKHTVHSTMPDSSSSIQESFLEEGIENKAYHTSMDDIAVSTLLGEVRSKIEESNHNLSHLIDEDLEFYKPEAAVAGKGFGVIQSAMTYAVEMLAVTHKYVIDIMQLSSDYSSSTFAANSIEKSPFDAKPADDIREGQAKERKSEFAKGSDESKDVFCDVINLVPDNQPCKKIRCPVEDFNLAEAEWFNHSAQ